MCLLAPKYLSILKNDWLIVQSRVCRLDSLIPYFRHELSSWSYNIFVMERYVSYFYIMCWLTKKMYSNPIVSFKEDEIIEIIINWIGLQLLLIDCLLLHYQVRAPCQTEHWWQWLFLQARIQSVYSWSMVSDADWDSSLMCCLWQVTPTVPGQF